MKLIPTILCGGAGSRLWPVSREMHLKSFVHLADGQSLLQKAWLRGAMLPDVAETLYEATQGGMAVTVFKAIDKTNAKTASVGVNGLLAYIESHPGQRAGEMAVAFKLTKRTIERWLKQLKTNGKIEYRGAAKTGGYYYLDADQ